MMLALLANIAATWFMVGLIWFVQMVHYPQFAQVSADSFIPYHLRHQRFTTFVVVGPMMVEAATAILLVLRPALIGRNAAWTGFMLVLIIWLSTALLQVPRHMELERGFNEEACQRLCRTNWIRTICWTARGLLMLCAITRTLPQS